MITPNSSSSASIFNALDFWYLQISKEFTKPEYYIGQNVLHKVKVAKGEILYPVKIMGITWTGLDWEYEVHLSSNHPRFKEGVFEFMTLSPWVIEPI